jgi:alpha-amylase/alpha-mannosidase (GH57 family)
MTRYVCIHGHFYQPPRENPWLGTVDLQESAYPFHDWNERVTAECYAPNTAARILDGEGFITRIMSTYGRISFSAGPTLLSWMEQHRPDVYEAVLAADRAGRDRYGGHGPAIAQGYSHLILPLATTRDKRTQVVWGIRDFASRFGREPEGMWLPETAVDLETLDIMAEEGIRFTILAPHQAESPRPIDTRQPYRCSLPSGRSIALFFYNGTIAQEVAFGNLLQDGRKFAKRLLGAFAPGDRPQLVHIATDGETYGHHRKFGDMALAYCLATIEARDDTRLTVYGEYLEKFPPVHEVKIRENTSWSCKHGIERWRSGCSCGTGRYPGGTHAWRTGLREGTDRLRDRLAGIFETCAAPLVRDPWQARNDYIDCIRDRSDGSVDRFLARNAAHDLLPAETSRLLTLLEMERQAMLMATSCGWFFDDLTEPGSVQVMRHAARAVQLVGTITDADLESLYVDPLRQAPGNTERFPDGYAVYTACVRPYVMDLPRVAVHAALLVLCDEPGMPALPDEYRVEYTHRDRLRIGDLQLCTMTVTLRSAVTREEVRLDCAVLFSGAGGFIVCGGRPYRDEAASLALAREVIDALGETDAAERAFAGIFGWMTYPLEALMPEEQKVVLQHLLAKRMRETDVFFRDIVARHGTVLPLTDGTQETLAEPPAVAAEYVLQSDLRMLLAMQPPDPGMVDSVRSAMAAWSVPVDSSGPNHAATARLTDCMRRLREAPENPALLGDAVDCIALFEAIPVRPDLWESQNILYAIGSERLSGMRQRATAGDPAAIEWVKNFRRLGIYLKVSFP